MNPFRQPHIIVGVALVIIGVIFVMMNLGVIEHVPLFRFWPLILVIIGLGKLAGDGRERWSGIWLLLLGVWFQMVTLRWYGLTYRNSWPALLIIWGLFIAGKALARQSQAAFPREVKNGN